MYEKGIVSGMGEGKFSPNGQVTREQFAKMLVRALGEYDENAVCSFSDVAEGSWYYSYVASAFNSGIVYGVSDESFGTGRRITREDMAVMAYRASVKAGKMSATDAYEVFADDELFADYSKEAVYTLKAHGIMSGKGENKFEPKAYATRAEAARIIYGLINLGGNS